MSKKISDTFFFFTLLVISYGFCLPQKTSTSQSWSPYLTFTYVYTDTSGFIKTKIIVKKDSVFYQSMEPGKELNRKVRLDTLTQQKIIKLIEDYHFLSLNNKKDRLNKTANSYRYEKDKFLKIINEPKGKRRKAKFDHFNKEFLGLVLPVIFKNEMKESWH